MTKINDIVDSYRFSVDEQAWTLDQMRIAAGVHHAPAYVTAIVRNSIAVVEQSREIDRAWAIQNGRQPDGGDAIAMAADIGELVTSVFYAIRGLALRKHTDAGRRADKLLCACFPKGLANHTGTNYPRQVELNKVLVQTLASDEHKEMVRELALADRALELKALNDRFAALVAPTVLLTFEEVAEAVDHGMEALLRAVCAVCGAADPSKPDEVAARTAILLPHVSMCARVAKMHRDRHNRKQRKVSQAVKKATKHAEVTAAAAEKAAQRLEKAKSDAEAAAQAAARAAATAAEATAQAGAVAREKAASTPEHVTEPAAPVERNPAVPDPSFGT
jgi:hypothetical protein